MRNKYEGCRTKVPQANWVDFRNGERGVGGKERRSHLKGMHQQIMHNTFNFGGLYLILFVMKLGSVKPRSSLGIDKGFSDVL